MPLLFRLLIALVGIFNVGLGLAFLMRPAEMGEGLHLLPDGIAGLASLRADLSAFFLGSGLFALLGAWRTQAAPLSVPILLYGIALFGRLLNLVLAGVTPAAFAPMLAEAVVILIMVGGIMAFDNKSGAGFSQ